MSDAAAARSTVVHFGSAHLFVGAMTSTEARALLEAAAQAGVARFDTAPLYGYGASEPLVAAVAREFAGIGVTTKVGLEPKRPPSALRRAASAWLAPWRSALRTEARAWRADPEDSAFVDSPSGRFASADVRRSIERSLARLGPIDRLLLHEVHAADVTDELLTLLDGYRARGDVARLGVATANHRTVAALQRSHGLFTIAHVSVDPFGEPMPQLRGLAGVRLVGHGVLGAEGRTLARWRRHLASDARLRARWDRVVAGSAFFGADGEANALCARAAAASAVELIVATARPGRVGGLVRAASGVDPLPAEARAMIERFLARSGAPAACRVAPA